MKKMLFCASIFVLAVLVSGCGDTMNTAVINTAASDVSNSATPVNTEASDINVNTSVSTNTNAGTTSRTIDIEEGTDYVCMDDLMEDLIAYSDSDYDSIMAEFEDMWGIKDSDSDTDADGFDDWAEIQGCYNPSGEGRMDGDYFENTFCPAWWEMALSHAEADDATYNDFMAIIPDFCAYWTSYADYYISAFFDGADSFDLKADEESDAYRESCEATLADSKLTDYFDYIFEINVEPDDRLELFCGFMIDTMSSMCGEYAGC